MNRNELCPCGSGRRYKHCHGAIEFVAPSAQYLEALAAHQSGSLRRAETLYREALAANPRDLDSLHMLGVVHFERRRYREALELLWDAAERTGWNDATLRQNLGLLLAKLLTPEANARQEALVAAYRARVREIEAAPVVASHVTVVLVCGQAATLGRAIESVGAQTYEDLDVVIVCDDPAHDLDDIARACASGLAVPSTVLRAESRGFAAAANQGARTAAGRYLAFLDGDDRFAPERVHAMVSAMGRSTPLWGFSRVRAVGAVAGVNPSATPKRLLPREFLGHDPPSFTLLTRNALESSANLFVDRALFLELGGYGGDARDCGWDFALRASRKVEGVVVPSELYVHAQAASPQVSASTTALSPDADSRAARRFLEAVAGDAAATNPFCPQYPPNRVLLMRNELRAGHGDRLPIDVLRALAAEWRARPSGSVQPRAIGTAQGGRVALVVLGMYRSGTSALARVLNLCGAFLPERVIAARLGINPKGFWEAEAVTDLDARMLQYLGGDWNRAGLALPAGGALVDEFVHNAREVLAMEYGDAPRILIKDPRVCVLAPLWDRALRESGFRPAYVVVVRHPLEVAGSLETQGDMPIDAGLELWLDYMARVETFVASTDVDAVHVRYADLLDDWVGVVRRVGHRLRVPLDWNERAPQIDEFLEAGMRNHRTNANLDAARHGARVDAVSALYQRLLERCDADASRDGDA
jgi:glycosyltransferase involved in cell wall biosynthesis